jgi:YVTN family beta-propeller protein
MDKSALLNTIECGKGAVGIDVTLDGKEIWVSNAVDNTVTVVDAATQNILATLKTNVEPTRLKISPNGKYCIVVNSTSGNISVFDVSTKKLLHTIVVPGNSNIVERVFLHSPHLAAVLFHPTDKYAFIANSNANKIVVIDTEKWKIVSNIPAGIIPDGLAVVQ